MKKREILVLLSVVVSYYILYFFLFNCYEKLIITNLNTTHAFLKGELTEFPIKKIKIYYPNFYLLVWFAIKIYKAKFLVGIFLALIISFIIYTSRLINKKFLFSILFVTTIVFLSDIFLEFINYKDKLGLTFRGRYIGIDLKLQQLHTTDEIGINIYLKETEDIIKEYTINNQGFRSTYNFDSATVNAIKDTSFVIMFIGDSHTDGCCANPITNSFVNLVDKQLNYTALNFGIGGTDPLQYKLIAQKYLLKIKPDLLIVNLCLGNDFINFERKPNPNHPLHFQTNYNWLDARYPKTHPNYQPDTYFKNWEEAKNFYLKHYTTKIVDNSKVINNIVSESNNLSFVILILKRLIYKTYRNNTALSEQEKNENLTYNYLNDIKINAELNNIPFILVGVPTIRDIGKEMIKVNQEYQNRLHNIHIAIPTNIYKEDFVSYENDHFNNTGHQKFADFLKPIIDSVYFYSKN